MARDPSVGYSLWAGVEVTFQNFGSESLRCQIEEALEQCDRALASSPRDVDVLLRKAAILLGPLTPTIDVFGLMHRDTLRDLGPTCGKRLRCNDRVAEAIAIFDAVLEIEPDHLKALWWRSVFLAVFEKWAEAVHDFDRMLQLDPDDGKTWSARGWCLHRHGEYLVTLGCYDRPPELGAGPVFIRERMFLRERTPRDVMIDKVETLIELGRFYEALEHLDMMHTRLRLPDEIFMRRYVLALLGRYREAHEHMNALLGWTVPASAASAENQTSSCIEDVL
jgi:tetratricopeptide repeat protein